MTRLRIGVVGVGHLGKEHARILSGLPEVELVGVADANAVQAGQVAERCGTRAFPDHRPLLALVDAAVIVVPTSYHHAVAREFLEKGIPVLVEKPLAGTLPQADELVALAHAHGVPLQVGHIERFNPAFEALVERPLTPKLIRAERCGGFSGRSTDIGVVLDLMIHDIDLVLTLAGAPVRDVSALGVSVLGGHEDTAQATLTFANGCVAQLSASRVHPEPLRRMYVWGPEGFASADFARRRLTLTQPAAHLRRSGFDSRRLDPATLHSLKTELFGKHLLVHEIDCTPVDQLTCELRDFADCVRTGGRPRVDGIAGREALAVAWRILDAICGHCWEGDSTGPRGPADLPVPRGLLFPYPLQSQDRVA
jgi:predicted dehydrogenase